MPRLPVLATVVVPFLLSACGHGGPTAKSASSDPEVVSSSIDYSPIYAEDGVTNESAMMDGGVSGFVANADGSLSQIRIRISEDGETAYVSIDGVPESEWSTRTAANGNSGQWTDGDGSLLVNWSGNSNTHLTLSDGDGTQTAIVGLETPLDALPTGTASYNGIWSTTGSSGGSGQGSLNLAINFSDGTIGGGMNGAYNAPGVNGPISGNVKGIATDSRIVGSITLDEGDVTGLLLFLGAVYGPDAKSVAGALGGTFDTVLGPDTQSGIFYLNGSGKGKWGDKPVLSNGCCQTNSNMSQFSADDVNSHWTKLTPLGESGGWIQFEIISAVERAFLVEVTVDGRIYGGKLL